MRYISTRGEAPTLGFSDALLTGLARDGGLYLPEEWPHFSRKQIRALRGKSYQDIAEAVLSPFIGGEIPAGLMFGIYTTDLLLHTWDLARATGQDDALDADLLERSWQNALALDGLIRGPGVFGPKVPVGDDAPPDVQALAFFGRDARS